MLSRTPRAALTVGILLFFTLARWLSAQPIVELEVRAQHTLPFRPAEVVHDAQRGTLWLSDPAGYRLVKMTLNDAWTTEVFYTSDLRPEAMSLSPDGQWLYVALVNTVHAAPVAISAPGALLEIDLTKDRNTRRMDFQLDPMALAATDRHRVVVSGAEFNTFSTRTVDMASGVVGQSVISLPAARLAMHPGQRRVYAVLQNLIGGGVFARIELKPEDDTVVDYRVLAEAGSSSFDQALAIHPDGTRLVTRWNGAFTLTDDPAQDFKPLGFSLPGYNGRPVFDAARKSIFGSAYVTFLDRTVTALTRHHSGSGHWISSHPMPAAEWVFPTATSLITVGYEDQGARIWSQDNPAAGAETNQPPIAAVTITPAAPKVGDLVKFDATVSTDEQPELTFAWDFLNYGGFESPGQNGVFERTFHTHGTRHVSVLVRDRHGETNAVRQRFDVSAPPEVVAGTNFSFELPFQAAEVVFDPNRPVLYAADVAREQVVTVNLDSGFVERVISVTGSPGSLALTPDGKWLYVVSVVNTLAGAYLSEIDLNAGVVKSRLQVGQLVYDLVATDRRKVVFTTTFDVMSHDFETGQPRSSISIATEGRLALFPDQNKLILGDASGAYHRLSVDLDTGALETLASSSSLSQAGFPQQPFLWPDGSQFLTTPDGKIFGTDFASGTLTPRLTLQWNNEFVRQAAFDLPDRKALFVATDSTLLQFNAATGLLVRSFAATAGLQGISARSDWLYLLRSDPVSNNTLVQRRPNPAKGNEGNLPPVAHFTMSSAQPTTRLPITFDARGTTDDHDSTNVLQFRWRYAEQTLQSDFSSNAVLAHRYAVPGRYTVRMEVRDSLGETSAIEQTFDVVTEPDPGESLSEKIDDTYSKPISDAVLDSLRPYVYFADKLSGDVLRWNFHTGELDRRWKVAGRAERLTLTPDGSRLYAAVNAGTTVNGNPLNGFVAEFDLASGTLTRHFLLDLTPFDLVATDSGHFIVCSGLEPPMQIHVHRRDTGERTAGVTNNWWQARFALHPSQRILYTADRDFSATDITRHDFDPLTGALTRRTSARENNPPDISIQTDGYVFMWPDGKSVISGSGIRFTSSSDPADDLKFIGVRQETYPSAVAVVPERSGIALANRWVARGLELFHGPDQSEVFSRPLRNGALGRSLTVRSNVVYVATDMSNGLAVERFVFPAQNAAENQPPSVSLLEPADGVALRFDQPVFIRALATDDDGSVTNLTLFADGELLTQGPGPQIAESFSLPEKKAYTLVAVAQDNFGAATTSAPIVIRVTDPPTASLLRPAVGQVIEAPADVEFEVAANDPDGAVRRVEFYFGSKLLGIATAPPYAVTVPHLTQYSTLSVIVEDDLGVRVEHVFGYWFLGVPGDEYARPFLLEGTNATAHASNRDATRQTGDPNFIGEFGNAGKTMWWRWRAPTNGIVTLSTAGSSFDTMLGVYVITNQTQRALVAANDDAPLIAPASQLKFRVTTGGDYRILVDGVRNSPGGDIVLNLAFEPMTSSGAPGNDAFASRVLLEGSNLVETASSKGANREAGEPQILTTVPGGRSLWWEWRAPAAGLVTLSTAGSSFDTLLGTYRGSGTLASLRIEQANDDDPRAGTHSLVRFAAGAGVRYFITVDGFAGLGGDVRLQLDFEPLIADTRPTNDAFENRIVIPGAPAVILGSNLGARTDSREPFAGGQPVWWSWTAPVTQPMVISTVGSSFDTMVTVHLGTDVTNLLQVARGNFTLKGQFDFSQGEVGFVAVAGQTYQIAVGADGQQRNGAVILSLSSGNPLPPAPLRHAGLDAQGRPQLGLEPREAHTAVILSSTNLVQWLAVRTNRFEPGALLPLETGLKTREFFRAVQWE